MHYGIPSCIILVKQSITRVNKYRFNVNPWCRIIVLRNFLLSPLTVLAIGITLLNISIVEFIYFFWLIKASFMELIYLVRNYFLLITHQPIFLGHRIICFLPIRSFLCRYPSFLGTISYASPYQKLFYVDILLSWEPYHMLSPYTEN